MYEGYASTMVQNKNKWHAQLSEFGEKKDVARVLEQKELKVASLTQEVNSLRSQVRSKDRVIFGFKRELSSMVHIGLPKDLEQAVKVGGVEGYCG